MCEKKEFSRVEEIFGVNVVVSSDAAEGLFGRLKFEGLDSQKRCQKGWQEYL